MFMERIAPTDNYPAFAGKLTPPQIAARSSWSQVPDRATTMAALHVIAVRPERASTVTELNPMDPGTVQNAREGDDTYLGWLWRPGGDIAATRAARP